MKSTLFILVMTLGLGLSAQNRVFRSGDQKLVAVKGEVVRIEADTAFIISSDRAKLLNEKLDELISAQSLNQSLDASNKELLEKLKHVQDLVDKLIKRMDSDGKDLGNDLDEIMAQLDANLESLKQNNQDLQRTNKDLSTQITTLNVTIKKLKKEIRGVWWNGIADKIVTGLLGVGAGVALTSF